MPRLLSPLRFLWLTLLCVGLSSCDSYTGIVDTLSERDANEILVFLHTRGFDVVKIEQAAATGTANAAKTYAIQVPSSETMVALAALNQGGYPRKVNQNLLDLFGTSGLVPSESEEDVKFWMGKANGIANTIRKIDGVLDADVQFSFPRASSSGLGKQAKVNMKAAVYVKHQGIMDKDATLKNNIKMLVCNAVSDLDFDNVIVVTDLARFAVDAINYSPNVNSGTDKSYVKVWGVIVEEGSATRFRILFFAFAAILALVAASLIWLIYKSLPAIRQAGGMKSLMSAKPFETQAATTEAPKTEEKKPEEQ